MIKNLPQGWRVEELNKCGKIVTGKTPSKLVKEYWNSKDIPFVKPDDFKNDDIIEFESGKDFISKQGFEKATKIPPYSVLVTCIGNIGKILINKNFITTNQQINTIIPHKNIHYKYLAYAIQKIKPIMIKRANAPVVPIINKTDFGKFEIPLPPLPQQEKIVKVLDNSASLIEQQKQLIEKYDVFLKSKFIEMFGDPITNPMGWKKTTCIHVADCIVPGRNKPKSFSGTYMPWITTGDLVDKKAINHSNSNLILSKEEIKEVRAKIIPENSIIFTCVGDLGIVSITKKPIVINQQLHSFQCKEDVVNNYFLMFNISMQKQYMYKMATSTTVPYMNKTTCNNIPTILPPIELQNKFASIVEKIEAIKEKETQKLNHLKTLHVSLMDKAFKGEIV